MMDDPRLKAKLLVQALVRRCGIDQYPAYVIRRGDPDSGAVMVKRVAVTGCTVFQTEYDRDGRRCWGTLGQTVLPEAEADAVLARRADRDCDIWVLEIEAPETWVPDIL